MLYYRVKPAYDQTRRVKVLRNSSSQVFDGIFVENELYTAKELKKFCLSAKQVAKMFKIVIIPKSKIYWFFGCRFANKEK